MTAGVNASESDRFGFNVAISGDTVVVGAPFDDDPTSQGPAYVFRSDDAWATSSQIKKLTADDVLGFSVAISGDTVVVGGFLELDATNLGSAYVFFPVF